MSLIKTTIKVSLVALLLRVLWVSSALYAPFVADDETQVRGCNSQDFSVTVNRDSGAVIAPTDTAIISTVTEFAASPEPITESIAVSDMSSVDAHGVRCRWILAMVPENATKAEIRRFGVSMRHRSEPVVIISRLGNPMLSLSNGIVARAAAVKFPKASELFEFPRVMTSYDANLVSETERSQAPKDVTLRFGRSAL